MDVLLFVDNSGSILADEFDAAQQAIASIATSILSRPGYRLAVVNWACTDQDTTRAGCRIDLATAPGANGGWYTTASSFAYAGNNSAGNRVCRSFGYPYSNCGDTYFATIVGGDYAQHGLKMLDSALYAGGGTGGTDGYNAPTVAPGPPTQRLMIIHLTDAIVDVSTRIAEVPASDAALGRYYYSNYMKNQRNALIVGVGVDGTSTNPTARQQLGAFSSKGGSSTDYDALHASEPSTQAYDTGTPRLATFAATFNASQIIAAANAAINATVPACVVLRKQTVDGYGSFDFTGGTNGLPSSLTRTTTLANNPSVGAAYGLTYFNTDTRITESIPSGWRMTGAACVNASSATVPGVTYNPATGLVTVPAAQITSGAQLTCTVTNTLVATIRLQKALPNGRAVATDQFTLGMSGTGAPAAVTTTGSGSTATGVLTHASATPGTAYTLSETAAAGANLASYATTYACTNARPGGQTPSGNGTSFAITPVAGDDLTCTFANAFAPPPNFGVCDAKMYLDQVNTAVSPYISSLYDVGYATSPFTYSVLGSGFARNGIGYNMADNYIYGITWNTAVGNQLVRVGADGSSTILGAVTGLPVLNYNNGVISPAGDYYVRDGGTGGPPTGNILYRINLATRVATPITLSRSIYVSDLAWHNGFLYGVHFNGGGPGTLVRIDPGTGTVTEIGPTPDLASAIALWGFSNGLYGSYVGPIYAIDPATGATTFMSNAPTALGGDGANCPGAAITFNADLGVTKTNTPASGPSDLPGDTYGPGETRTYTLVVRNNGTFGAHDVTVSDPLPAGIATASWTCSGTGGGSCTASGGGAINDTDVGLPPGATVTYLLTLTVPVGYTGDLSNTATVTPGPATNDANPTNNTAMDVDVVAIADVAVTKTASPTTVVSGGVVDYTLVVTNNGPTGATNVRLSDTPAAGQDCTLPSGTATCVAAGGASCPSPTVPVATLLGSGITLPSLPVGGQVTVVLRCTVTASGQ
ncbi:DUF11 domain-containing protein [Pseudoxanthomonas sp. Root630]|uniref:DUF11 domain-containing protein n=1 Tax=Pseudoxanthomonas sp. Root630 TaxID=1736574 RepID=UPI000712C139|nr:DUF11 domain-containing protein [Pseudoxanthomonas sp. Root630]KRA45023.1 hypothetical protein ASD72_07075 [Pseudoxanthomonas sp. Root630]